MSPSHPGALATAAAVCRPAAQKLDLLLELLEDLLAIGYDPPPRCCLVARLGTREDTPVAPAQRVPSRTMPADVVGAGEIAQMLGVSRQRVNQLADSPGFPKPWRTLAQGRIWDLRAIERWAEKTGRKLKALG